jgi:bacillithiol system protein YtxJ
MQNAERQEPFLPVAGIDSLDELFLRSNDGPVILFKHSLTCPISSSAYFEMQKMKSDVALVVMQNARETSNEIERRTGIRHESPQVIILRNGKPVWNASHWSINADAVESASRDNA